MVVLSIGQTVRQRGKELIERLVVTARQHITEKLMSAPMRLVR